MPVEHADGALGASYRLVELIGRGASGEVWRGVDQRTDTTIAAKLLRPEHAEDGELVERFLRERSILTGLRHENVVAVRDLVVEGDRVAIVMEHVDGGTLRTALRTRGTLAPRLALGVTCAVLDGLAAAHDRRVLHRDVKPDNVLLAARWSELAPGAIKLSDFGVSRILADRPSSSTGLVGTPEYMAPEQLVTGEAGLPGDVYGAGIMLYELLAGRTPFAGPGSGYTVAHRHVTAVPPRLPVPDRLWAVLAAMLDKNPERRPTARVASARLRALQPELAGLAPLAAQPVPDGFVSAGGAPTEVRGLVRPTASDTSNASVDTEPAAMPDLGDAGHETVLRSMPTLPARVVVPASTAEPKQRRRPFWRDRRALALVVAGLLLIGGGVYWVTRTAGRGATDPPPTTGVVRAQQQSEVAQSGLGVSRTATWDPQARTVQLEITYSAQRAPLSGPFLEVLPGLPGAAGCPAVDWQQVTARLNQSAVTGIDTACAWSVVPAQVAARQRTTVDATVPLSLGADAATALQQWLDAAAAATDAATSDSQVTSTSYPAQRLTDVQVVAPTRTVSGRTLQISLVPVWPSGADNLNPLFRSPATGDPSSLLVAVAGGTSGVRFGDACSGALAISGNGLVVTAQSVADACQVSAQVGNFTDLTSNTFTIATRGS